MLPHPHPIVLVHDRSPIHTTSNVVREWLTQHPEVHPLDWPPKGCDINPIENMWATMSREWDVSDDISCAAAVPTSATI